MKLLFCENCREYSLEEICPRCKQKTKKCEPARFSFLDKYGKYRRMMRHG